jgi:hypothetical protein
LIPTGDPPGVGVGAAVVAGFLVVAVAGFFVVATAAPDVDVAASTVVVVLLSAVLLVVELAFLAATFLSLPPHDAATTASSTQRTTKRFSVVA